MEVFGPDGNKLIWGVLDDHVVEAPTDHDEIGLRGLDFNFFDEDDKRLGREGYS